MDELLVPEGWQHWCLPGGMLLVYVTRDMIETIDRETGEIVSVRAA